MEILRQTKNLIALNNYFLLHNVISWNFHTLALVKQVLKRLSDITFWTLVDVYFSIE